MYKKIVEYIVKHLVDKADKAEVKLRSVEDNTVIIEISVEGQDRGRIIGKEGQTIRAIRMLVSALASPGQEIQVILAE